MVLHKSGPSLDLPSFLSLLFSPVSAHSPSLFTTHTHKRTISVFCSTFLFTQAFCLFLHEIGVLPRPYSGWFSPSLQRGKPQTTNLFALSAIDAPSVELCVFLHCPVSALKLVLHHCVRGLIWILDSIKVCSFSWIISCWIAGNIDL